MFHHRVVPAFLRPRRRRTAAIRSSLAKEEAAPSSSPFVDSLAPRVFLRTNGLNEPDTTSPLRRGLIHQPRRTLADIPLPRYTAYSTRRLRLSPIYQLARVYSVTTGVAPGNARHQEILDTLYDRFSTPLESFDEIRRLTDLGECEMSAFIR